MNIRQTESTWRVQSPAYVLELDLAAGAWRFGLSDGSEPVLRVSSPLLLVPEIPGAGLVPGSLRLETLPPPAADRPRLLLSARLAGAVDGWVSNEVVCLEDRLVCRSEYSADRPHAVAHWNVAPPDSTLAAESIHAYIGNPDLMTNGQWFDPGAADLSTASHNWLYSPMSPRVVFKRRQFLIGLGGTTPAHDFGLELRTAGGRVQHFRFNYGGSRAPLRLPAGDRHAGPRLQIQVTLNRTADQAHGAFTQAMMADGLLAPRRYRPEEAGWRRAWYCTFGDQMALSQAAPADQAGTGAFLNHDLVLRAATTIRRNELDIGTFIIDEGWNDRRGDWNVNTERFPDLRGTVDALHAMGFKVLLWWAPFLTAPDARVRRRPDVLATSPGHGEVLLDYARPAARAYMEEKLDRWFSAGPGGFDLDGVKIDFMAEKVYAYPEMADVDWRGEERLFQRLFGWIHAVASRHKECPGILGEAYNPFMAEKCIAFQFEERFDRNLDYVEQRPAMAEALLPGAWYAPHFTYHTDLIVPLARKVRAVGGIPQIGKVIAPDITPGLLAELRVAIGQG